MFKKAAEAKSHQRLSGADRKKLRRTVQNRFSLLTDELLDAILPPKVEITVSKFQNRVLVYSIEGGCPMFFDIDGRGNEILPTVFALWEAPEMLPSFMLKGGEVSRYVLGGADLMFPGILIPPEGFPSFSAGEIWSVKVPGNAAPIAVGFTTMSSEEGLKAGLRGKALRIAHYYRDFLWESAEGHYVPNAGFWEDVVMEDPAFLASGSGEEVSDALAGQQTSTGNEEDESALETASTSATDAKNGTEEEQMVGSMNEVNLGDDISANEANTEKQNPLSTEEVDALLDKCLLQALHTTLKEKDLPLPGSTLWANHVLPCRPPGITLDIKKSSHKKLSKWLQSKASAGMITVKEDKHKKEIVLISVNRRHPDYSSFKPEKKKAEVSESSVASSTAKPQSDKMLEIIEVYKPSIHNSAIFASVGGQAWDGVVITQADYQGLQAVKQEFIDPRGYLRSWNGSGINACSGGWAGIKCAQGQVIVIQLPWKSLGGRISEKIGQLQALRKLSLHDNNLGGSIPMSLGLIPNLRGVQLFNNRLSGSIPASLGLSRFLQTLDLSSNLLSQAIPQNLADSTKLLRLNLSFNSLSGQVPVSLTRSSSLQFLALDHNNLSGPVLDTWGSTNNTSPSLRVLSLDHNSLSGPFPFSLCKLLHLQGFSLSHNRISGTLPSELSKLTKLRTMDVSSNSVSGQIPETLGNISSLTHLDLSQNKLTGEIPVSLTGLKSLTFFNVSYNNLSGPVPTLLSQKFSSSAFVGNLQLCGYSVSTLCPTLNPPSPSPRMSLSTKDILLIASGALIIILVILVFVLICCLLRKKQDKSKPKGLEAGQGAAAAKTEKGGEAEAEGGDPGGKLVHFDGPMTFTADDLLCATAEIMGKSTYGTVYKTTLEDGNQVAVKRLREKITKSQKEFENEINVLGRIRHPNLLALRAYYLGPKGEKLVVFDYMTRGSLATFLHARGQDVRINWPTRMSLIKGMARGLFYLHTHANLIHGNLTSNNVLLDENLNAKISDYGLSRLMTTAAGSSVIATAGALGYRAPELSKLKKANTKTDVYSLGVIILELLTGKSPSEALNGVDLPQWVAAAVKEESTNEVFDVELLNDVNTVGDEMLNTLKLALHCVDPAPSARPEAQQVMTQLREIRPEETSATTSEPLIDVPVASASTSQ